MPMATSFGMLTNLIWIVSGMVIYDAVTSGVGAWTWETAFAYGLVSIAASLYFKKFKANRTRYVGFALVATLFYDALTGVTFGPLFHHQSFMIALSGQIPFTLAHLASNFLLAAFLAPIIQKWLIENPALELSLPEKAGHVI